MLTRDQILKAKDREREEVEVPEWGGTVYVSVMSGRARDAWESSLVGDNGKPVLDDISAKLAAACMTDDKGQPLFTPADVRALSEKSAAALQRVVAAARRLNRLGVQGVEDAKGN